MLIFSAKKTGSFLITAFEVLITLGIIIKGLTVAWSYFDIHSPELVWAYTIATGFATLYIAMFVCFTRQAVYETRIDEKSVYCAELEQMLLKKRLSSRHKN